MDKYKYSENDQLTRANRMLRAQLDEADEHIGFLNAIVFKGCTGKSSHVTIYEHYKFFVPIVVEVKCCEEGCSFTTRVYAYSAKDLAKCKKHTPCEVHTEDIPF